MKTSSTKIQILDAAQDIIQLRGYNGFSFADISEVVNIRKASIHHHFPNKSDLGAAVIRRYREVFNELLEEADSKGSTGIDKIHNYVKLYEEVLAQNKLCLCGILGTDAIKLPKPMKKEAQKFLDDNIMWLSHIIKSNFKLITDKNINNLAWHIISSLQGGILLARMYQQKNIFLSVWNELKLRLKSLD